MCLIFFWHAASCGESVEGCWYVFSPRNRRYPNGDRPARSVGEVGFWKSNTKETDITVGGTVIGKHTMLTFELGKQPKGEQTPWKMREYSIPEKQHKPVRSCKKHKPDDSPNMQVTMNRAMHASSSSASVLTFHS
jgi:hypothetical protein